ncbi:MAG: Uncharacterised protein [Cellulomonadaceae bacterium TMED98]|nr:MAG: Uncharacterised protein [Cellulomonadaceae bacterium TMED98]
MSVELLIRRTWLWGIVGVSVVAVVASVAGALVAELEGMLAALLGTAVGFAFLALTPLSITWALKAGQGDVLRPGFFAVVLGVWLVKFIVFLALVFWLGDVAWAHQETLFLTIVGALLVGLIVEVTVVVRSRPPEIDVEIPGSSGSS